MKISTRQVLTISTILSLCSLLVPTSLHANGNNVANDYDLKDGSLTLTATSDCSEGDPHVVTYTGGGENNIIIDSGEHYVMIKDVNIDAKENHSAIDVKKSATLHLILSGTNTLKNSGPHANIHVPETATLSISSENAIDTNTLHILNNASSFDSTAIGGSEKESAGTTIIHNGDIYIETGGTGIGGGSMDDASGTAGNGGKLSIEGGTLYIKTRGQSVTSWGKFTSRAIGGGYNFSDLGGKGGNGSEIIMSGGNLYAIDYFDNVAIGPGAGYTYGNVGTMKNKKGEDLVLYTLTLQDPLLKDTFLSSLVYDGKSDYGMTNVKTNADGNIYVYLPEGVQKIEVADNNGNVYKGKIANHESLLSTSYVFESEQASSNADTPPSAGDQSNINILITLMGLSVLSISYMIRKKVN